jgi:hypothetical protein
MFTKRQQAYDYDPYFEVLMTLVLLARHGRDVNAVLIAAAEPLRDELAGVPEFVTAVTEFQRALTAKGTTFNAVSH